MRQLLMGVAAITMAASVAHADPGKNKGNGNGNAKSKPAAVAIGNPGAPTASRASAEIARRIVPRSDPLVPVPRKLAAVTEGQRKW